MPPATLTPADPEIEIFAAGTHTAASGVAITMTPADLAGIAAAYDPGRHEAPLVIGHPTTNGPAYGWVQQLRVTGDRLLARPHQVNPEFAELVRSKLKVGGILHMATDWEPYAEYMLEVMNVAPGYRNLAEDGKCVPRPTERPITKFERRGERLGHGVWDLKFEKLA